MPLNIQNSEEQKKSAPVEPAQPTALPEAETPGRMRNILLWIILLVAMASALFLLFQFGIITTGGDRSDTAVVPRDTAVPPAQEMTSSPTDAGTRSGKGRSADLRERLTRVEGEYTIFISAFHEAGDAAELAGRWEKAGYPAFVEHTSGWYRVALGRYTTVAIARGEAEKIRQALEEGYWIGRAGN